MKKLMNIIVWIFCLVILSHNSACVGIATGALEELNRQKFDFNK